LTLGQVKDLACLTKEPITPVISRHDTQKETNTNRHPIGLKDKIDRLEIQIHKPIGTTHKAILKHNLLIFEVTYPNEASGAKRPFSATRNGVGIKDSKSLTINMSINTNAMIDKIDCGANGSAKKALNKANGSLPKVNNEVTTT
jgi:hypothetical protein